MLSQIQNKNTSIASKLNTNTDANTQADNFDLSDEFSSLLQDAYQSVEPSSELISALGAVSAPIQIKEVNIERNELSVEPKNELEVEHEQAQNDQGQTLDTKSIEDNNDEMTDASNVQDDSSMVAKDQDTEVLSKATKQNDQTDTSKDNQESAQTSDLQKLKVDDTKTYDLEEEQVEVLGEESKTLLDPKIKSSLKEKAETDQFSTKTKQAEIPVESNLKETLKQVVSELSKQENSSVKAEAKKEISKETIEPSLVAQDATISNQEVIKATPKLASQEIFTGLLLRQANDAVKFALKENNLSTKPQVQNIDSVATTKLQTQVSKETETKSQAPIARYLPLRNLEKIRQIVKEAVESKEGKTVSLRLDPPSLGSIKVDVTLKDGSLHARIVADSPQSNLLLREKAFDLQKVLSKSGLNVDTVSVSVGSSTEFESGVGQNLNNQTQQEYQSQQDGNLTGWNAAGIEVGVDSKGSEVDSSVKDHWVA